jgi:hypothetical protein
VPAVEPQDVFRFYGDLPESFVSASFTPRWTTMRTGKEIPYCLGEVAQRLLLHRYAACSQPLELRPCFAGISKIALSFVAERKGFQRMEAQ